MLNLPFLTCLLRILSLIAKVSKWLPTLTNTFTLPAQSTLLGIFSSWLTSNKVWMSQSSHLKHASLVFLLHSKWGEWTLTPLSKLALWYASFFPSNRASLKTSSLVATHSKRHFFKRLWISVSPTTKTHWKGLLAKMPKSPAIHLWMHRAALPLITTMHWQISRSTNILTIGATIARTAVRSVLYVTTHPRTNLTIQKTAPS